MRRKEKKLKKTVFTIINFDAYKCSLNLLKQTWYFYDSDYSTVKRQGLTKFVYLLEYKILFWSVSNFKRSLLILKHEAHNLRILNVFKSAACVQIFVYDNSLRLIKEHFIFCAPCDSSSKFIFLFSLLVDFVMVIFYS